MKKIFFLVSQFLIFLLRCVYAVINNGTKCIICNERSFIFPVCNSCTSQYFNVKQRLSVNRCNICGKELISNDTKCSKCTEKAILKSPCKVLPLFSYRLWNKELMFLWKINGERVLSNFFSKIIGEALEYFECNYIVPVPPRKGKISRNGWDQINDLCQFLQYKYGYVILELLERHSKEQQKKLNRTERLETIKTAYSLVNPKVLDMELRKCGNKIPEQVVLLDDVCTTGATIESCSYLLKEYGIKKVNVITLFSVD